MYYLSLATEMDQDAKTAITKLLTSDVATLVNLRHIKTRQQVIDLFQKLANSLKYHLFSKFFITPNAEIHSTGEDKANLADFECFQVLLARVVRSRYDKRWIRVIFKRS